MKATLVGRTTLQRAARRLLWPLVPALLLAGCKVELYSGLPERDANAMLAVLLRHHIDSDKQPGKEGAVTLRVAEERIAEAVDLLRDYGYPRDKFDSIGALFPKEGLISSPLEERIRYIYALSQEVSQTLSQIEGVITARVHLVMPEGKPFDKTVVPASASVFIKHREGTELAAFVPQIKMIVNNGIQGLTYDKISVALFPAPADALVAPPPLAEVGWLRLAPASVTSFWLLIGTLLTLALGALSGNIYQFLRPRKRAEPTDASGAR
ncbi:MAG: type III secretion inner membrane ring lipoprotein SctJ [Candidatus Competibacter sp.]